VALLGADYWQAHPVFGQMLLFMLALPTTVAMASVSWRLIEKPGISLGKMVTSRAILRQNPA
jgi:peptidoglycan/LPS O-acetylase OafA/YrhL